MICIRFQGLEDVYFFVEVWDMEKKQKGKSMKQQTERKKSKELNAKDNQPDVNKATEKSDDSFDFGGLPERNLKKNLGCG
jgi:hypothetical protein